jgi:hypothetical protein
LQEDRQSLHDILGTGGLEKYFGNATVGDGAMGEHARIHADEQDRDVAMLDGLQPEQIHKLQPIHRRKVVVDHYSIRKVVDTPIQRRLGLIELMEREMEIHTLKEVA